MKLLFLLLLLLTSTTKTLALTSASSLNTPSIDTLNTNQSPLKILLHCSIGGKSHVKYLLEISNSLIARGHTVTFASNEESRYIVNGYPVPFVSLGPLVGLDGFFDHKMKEMTAATKKRNNVPIIKDLFYELFINTYKSVYPGLLEYASSSKPDVMICDFFAPACRDVAKKLRIPLISGFQTIDGYQITNNRYLSGDYYNPTRVTRDKMSFLERAYDVLITPVIYHFQFWSLVNGLNKVRRSYNIEPTTSIYGDFHTNLGLANTYTGFEPALHLPPNIKLIGPIISEDKTELCEKYKSFVGNRTKILLIAFGTNFRLSSKDVNTIIKGAIHSLNSNVIDGIVWGLGHTSLSVFPKHFNIEGKNYNLKQFLQHPDILIQKWIPQRTLLGHKSIKLFLTHGGLESLFETIYAKTPVLCMSIFGDQHRNCQKANDMGIGIPIDKFALTPKYLKKYIQQVVVTDKEKYQVSLTKMKLIHNLGFDSKNTAVKHIESYTNYAKICRKFQPNLINGISCEADIIVPACYKMSIWAANNYDVYLFLLIACVTVLFVARNLFNEVNSKLMLEDYQVNREKIKNKAD